MTTITAIYGARKQAGLDDDTARDVYQRATGKRSLRDMSPGEQVRVLQELRRLGNGAAPAEGPYGKKLQALWISGWHLGVVRDRRDAAMLSFVTRQTGLEATRFLRAAADARRAVEALKGWIGREAKVDWLAYDNPADAVIAAQGKLLDLYGRTEPGDMSVIAQAWRAWRLGELKPRERHAAMALLGVEIRRRK